MDLEAKLKQQIIGAIKQAANGQEEPLRDFKVESYAARVVELDKIYNRTWDFQVGDIICIKEMFAYRLKQAWNEPMIITQITETDQLCGSSDSGDADFGVAFNYRCGRVGQKSGAIVYFFYERNILQPYQYGFSEQYRKENNIDLPTPINFS